MRHGSFATLAASAALPGLVWSIGCGLIAGVEDGQLAPDAGGTSTDAASSTSTTGGFGGGMTTDDGGVVEPPGGGGAGMGTSSTGSGASVSTGASSATSTSSGGTTSTGSGGASVGYAAEVLKDKPLAYWRFGESVTPVIDDASGNSHKGTYQGGIILGAPGALAGDSDTAATFDGSNDVATFGDVFDFVGKTPFSLEMWIKITNTDGPGVFSKCLYTPGEGYLGLFLAFQPSGEIGIHRTGGNAVASLGVTAGVFTHVVATFDGVTLLLFLDGGQVGADVAGAEDDVADNGQPFVVGHSDTWGSFPGTIDEVAVYNHALPPTRIAAHYAAAKLP